MTAIRPPAPVEAGGPATRGLCPVARKPHNRGRGADFRITQLLHAKAVSVRDGLTPPSGRTVSVAVVVNSGSVGADAFRGLQALLSGTYPGAQVFETASVGEFRRFAAMAGTRGFRRVIVAGGDGTLQSAAHEFAGTPVEVGLLPMGTENDFARLMGIPAELRAAATVAFGSTVAAIDVGIIHCRDHGFRAVKFRFINIAEMGLAGGAARGSITAKGWIVRRLVHRAGRIMARRSSGMPVMRLVVDGTDVGTLPTAQLIVGNGQFLGGGLRPLPHARINDGWFEVARIREASASEVIELCAREGGLPREHPQIDHWRARRIEVTSDDPVAIEADGEPIGWLPASFEVEPGNLRLVVPAR